LKSLATLVLLAVFAVVFSLSSDLCGEENLPLSGVPRVTKEQIKELVGQADFVLLDVRPNEQWRATQVKLPGAIHEDPEDVKGWAEKYQKSARVVTY